MEKLCEPAPMHIIEKLKLRNKVHAPGHKLWRCAYTLDNEPKEGRHLRSDQKFLKMTRIVYWGHKRL